MVHHRCALVCVCVARRDLWGSRCLREDACSRMDGVISFLRRCLGPAFTGCFTPETLEPWNPGTLEQPKNIPPPQWRRCVSSTTNTLSSPRCASNLDEKIKTIRHLGTMEPLEPWNPGALPNFCNLCNLWNRRHCRALAATVAPWPVLPVP